MTKINENFLKLPKNYLFAEIANGVEKYKREYPNTEILKLGIGDVTRPLPRVIVKAMQEACEEMLNEKTFRGYGPYEGYEFLRKPIAESYRERNVDIEANEIFVNDGAKADTANIIEIFDSNSRIAVCDPVYPVYIDSNALAGRLGDFDKNTGKWSKVLYMPCTKENNFIPEIPEEKVDLIYLCFPNNPTGEMISKDELQKWVDYANNNGSVILYDAAYEAYITQNLPHTIYECDGAKTCAIEFKSLSKDAGFTGIRSGYTVIPNDLKIDGVQLNSLWMRRQSTKYNGSSFIIQRGAAARYTEEGKKEVKELISYYQNNAKIIYDGLKEIGLEVYGAINSPYIWLKTVNNMTSWDFFDLLLNKAHVVGTPGSGFGPSGEGYFRLTSFGSRETTEMAVKRIKENI